MKEKMKLLCQSGVIDEDIFCGMLLVINDLERIWGRSLPEQQGWMAMVHMANALMRSRQGQTVEPLDSEVLQEIEESGELASLKELNNSLLTRFTVSLYPNEEGYLLANLFGLSTRLSD